MRTEDSSTGERAPQTQQWTGGSPRRPGRLRVAVLGELPSEIERARRWLREARELELVDPLTGEPEVLFCVAGSAWRMVSLLDPFGYPYPPAALLDLVVAIGPSVAALHGILGYLTPACPQSRWLDAIQRAARLHPYALAPYDEQFLDAWADGPLTKEQRQILRLAPLGLSKEVMDKRLGRGWNLSRLYRAEQVLRQRLGLEEGEALAAAAVELGLHRFWPVPVLGF